jgi:hypothetical protein
LRQIETDEALASRGIDRWGFPLPRRITLVQPASEPLPTKRQAGAGSFSEEKMLPALRRMCSEAAPGQKHTRHEIAAACDVDKETIRNVEKRALKKIRARLGPHFLKQLGALTPQFSDVTYRHVSLS